MVFKAGIGVGVLLLLTVTVGILTFYYKRRQSLKSRDTLIDNEGLCDNERGYDQSVDATVFEESSENLESQLSDETDSCSILEGRKLFLNMDWTAV